MTDAYILESVKDYCQVPQEADIYDSELCGHINTAFFTLFQLGCSARPFTVTDESATWEDFTDNPYISSIVPEYVKRKVKLLFDPPANSFLVTQMKYNVPPFHDRFGLVQAYTSRFADGLRRWCSCPVRESE